MIDPATVTVTIYGHEYTLRGEDDAEYVEKVAVYVDRKMNEVAENAGAMSTTKVAILAAINIVDELFRERQKRHEALSMLDERTGHIARLLDQEVGERSGA
jgi:cell division protein ZapA